MPVQSSGRSYPLRSRAASCAVSFDALSTAAHAAFNIVAPYYSPLADTSADHSIQAEEDTEEGEEGAVVGGKMDVSVSSSTDSGVRVGQRVHSGHVAAKPARRAVSDTTTTTSKRALPRYITNTIITELVCTLQSCSHCCKCHLRHNKSGYGKCMKSARQPWPDCECAGKCEVGHCAQTECASNRTVIDVSTPDSDTDIDSHSDSQCITTLPATQSPQQQQQHKHNSSHHSSDVCVASHSSILSSPLPGVRREAGGVHVDEEVCISPQAGAYALSTAAYRQPSTTVIDSGSVASQVVREADGNDSTTRTIGNSDGAAGTSSLFGVPVDRQLPKAVLDQLPSLPHPPHRLTTIADGRCSVASVLLAIRFILDAHINDEGRRIIDTARRGLGRVMVDKWTEADWIRRVPIHVRGAHMPYINVKDRKDNHRHSSYNIYHKLLTEAAATTWLDHAVFYLASFEYEVVIFVIHQADSGEWYCKQIGERADSHIVLYHACGHYEPVEYNGLRQFPSDHEFITRVSEFATRHPEQPYEEDVELQALEAHEQACAQTRAADVATPFKGDTQYPPVLLETPKAVSARLASKRAASKQRGKSKAKRANDLTGDAVKLNTDTSAASVINSDGVKQLPPLIAQVAQHGPLYERVSFHNQAQWRAANEPLWNAYRLASIAGQRSQLIAILLDILLLPQRVLPKLGRSGRAARRRASAATGHRLRSEAERLRARYNCPDPHPKDGQQTQMSTETMLHTAAQGGYKRPKRAASVAATDAIRRQAADTTDTESDSEVFTVEREMSRTTDASDSEHDEPFPALRQHDRQRSADPDSRAARKAAYLVQCGLTRKAAQTLHSTTQVANLREAVVQETMLQLHPRPPFHTAPPTIPEGSPPSVLEDDADLRKLLIQSDNGASAGPSGWCGNMLSTLAQSEMCRLGVIALLRDIINGELPEDARQLLLASRLVALAKPNSDGYRPIAVGELFYRLAAIVAVKRVSTEAAQLLAPHQYGVGVAAGAEKVVHSLQHELCDSDKRVAMLQLDITNAFNSCDRTRLLRELYTLSDLQSVFRIADFAYSQPSALVLSGCDGQMIDSAQGVRQGDPLSALLFCIYMRDMLQQVSSKTGVQVYGFFDDINLLGTPQQLVAALTHLQQSLPAVSLQLNTSKSHFVYFHHSLTPLTASVLSALSNNDIQLHHDWACAVGAVVGRDDAAIRMGMHSILSGAGSYDTFLRRLQLNDMPVSTAQLLLRQCMVPAMNYYLRCIAPTCIQNEAQHFDRLMIEAATTKLGLDGDEVDERTTALLERRLRDGGYGLTSAVRTSPAAFLGSLATCTTESTFTPYCDITPLPSSSLLHGWIDDSLSRVGRAAPGEKYQADIEPLLPASAGDFFSHFAATALSVTTKLQHSLNAKATLHTVAAAVESMKEREKPFQYAHHKAITAKGASWWKSTTLDDVYLRLSDVEYAIAARLSLGLQPFPAQAMIALPEHCPLCTHNRTGKPVSLRDDPWHFLTCTNLSKGELSHRHDAVVEAISRVALMVGAQVRKEVRGLDPNSGQRPDLQIVFPGRMLLTDVVVSHRLTAIMIAQRTSPALSWQNKKDKKYAGIASRIGAELLNMSLDTSGGMASDAVRLVKVIGEEGEKWSRGTWSSNEIERQLLGAIAVAVQRGNALAMLTGYTRVTASSRLGQHAEEQKVEGGESASR